MLPFVVINEKLFSSCTWTFPCYHLDINLNFKANNHTEGWTYSFSLIPYVNSQNMVLILSNDIGRKQWFEILSVYCEKNIWFGWKMKLFYRLAIRS